MTNTTCFYEHTENDFWRFSLSVYSEKRIESLCLILQDVHTLDINELLFAAWLGRQERKLELTLLRADQELTELQAKVLTPLRHARRAMKHIAEASSAYQKLKLTELSVEQHIQAYLWCNRNRFSVSKTSETPAITQQVQENVLLLWQTPLDQLAKREAKTPPDELIEFCEWMIRYTTGKI
ncbi:TIGR02444 family protein [Marinomonas agarivorans]|nr:TIGR02444 family protein [Marinomonas agarivorans]